jgi:hypothetical protein
VSVRVRRCLLRIRFIQIDSAPLSIIHPGRRSQRLFANLSAPAMDAVWAMPLCSSLVFRDVSLPPWSRSQFQFLIPRPPSSGGSTLAVQPSRAKQVDTLYACLFCAATGRNVRAMMLVSHSRRPSYSPCAPHSVHYFHSSTYTWILFAFPCPGRFLSTFDWVSSQCRRPQEGQPDPPPRITPSGGATAGPGHHSLSPAATRWKLAGAMSSSRGVARKARCRWSWGWGVFLSMSSCPRWETKSGSPCSQGAADASPLLPKRDDSRPL